MAVSRWMGRILFPVDVCHSLSHWLTVFPFIGLSPAVKLVGLNTPWNSRSPRVSLGRSFWNFCSLSSWMSEWKHAKKMTMRRLFQTVYHSITECLHANKALYWHNVLLVLLQSWRGRDSFHRAYHSHSPALGYESLVVRSRQLGDWDSPSAPMLLSLLLLDGAYRNVLDPTPFEQFHCYW